VTVDACMCDVYGNMSGFMEPPVFWNDGKIAMPHRRLFSEAASGMACRWREVVVTASRASPSVREEESFCWAWRWFCFYTAGGDLSVPLLLARCSIQSQTTIHDPEAAFRLLRAVTRALPSTAQVPDASICARYALRHRAQAAGPRWVETLRAETTDRPRPGVVSHIHPSPIT
jgi:hypothetical protein